MNPVRVLLFLLPAAVLAVSSCQTSTKKRDDRINTLTDNKKAQPGRDDMLIFSPPKSVTDGAARDRWTKVPRQGGAEWAQAKNGMDDVVSFYGFGSSTDGQVRSLDDLERLVRSDPSLGFDKLTRTQVLGTPVLRFEKYTKDEGGASARLAAALAQPPRNPAGAHFIRTHGALLFRAGNDPQFITLACARTNAQGETGTHYEEVFDAFLSDFVANNMQGAAASSAPPGNSPPPVPGLPAAGGM